MIGTNEIGFAPKTAFKDCIFQLKPPFVLLDSAATDKENQKSYLFDKFEKILVLNPGDDPKLFFKKIEECRNKGYWLAGYLAYELGYYLEPALISFRKDPSIPLAWLGVSLKPKVLDFSRVIPGRDTLDYKIKKIKPNIKQQDYLKQINQIKKYLKDGFTYQVNYTFKIKFDFQGQALGLYNCLRQRQPTAYTSFINLGDTQFLSFSPELFFRSLKKTIVTRPMKGTMPRGITPEEDESFKRALRESEKTRAENLMIVDLLRNDLGRVSQRVKTKRLFDLEKHQTLYQMTSTIEGKLKSNLTSEDVLKSLFPSGSVTGAPKIKTMQIISELEEEPRNIYTGSIGYMSSKRACFNVAIRTIQIQNNQGEIGIGGGIVYDSQAKKEYEEAILKAKFFIEGFRQLSLIESIRWDKKKGFYLLDLHLKRLRKSCRYFSISFREKNIKQELERIVSGQKGQIKLRVILDRAGRFRIDKKPIEKTATPVKLKLSRRKTNPQDIFLYHKTNNRKLYDSEKAKANREGFFEVIFMNKNGEVTEGSISNLFILKGKNIYTPPLNAGVLPGVLREYLIKEKGVKEKKLGLSDLAEADKVYVGNSVRGLLEADIEQVKYSGIISKI